MGQSHLSDAGLHNIVYSNIGSPQGDLMSHSSMCTH